MMHLAEYRKRPSCLADYLPWAGLVAPGVVLNKDGSLSALARGFAARISTARPSPSSWRPPRASTMP